MRLLLDADVLYPTVRRELLLGAAAEGLLVPLWSPRILEEWARAAARLGAEAEGVARAEVAAARDAFPGALVEGAPEGGLWLPDPGDVHVLAAAIAGGAEGIVTANARDFPRPVLARHGLRRHDPDELLAALARAHPAALARVAAAAAARATRLSGEAWDAPRLLRKARLSRLARALAREEEPPVRDLDA